MFKLLYDLFIRAYYMGIKVAAGFNSKARLLLDGQKKSMMFLTTIPKPKKPVVWFHCASLGEFEQGRPVIEAYREKQPDCYILLTFFSPSGYEVQKEYSIADKILYLPIDIKSRVTDFLDYFQPKFAVFVKYEFWYNYLEQLYNRKTPTYLISANFRPSHWFFKWYGRSFRKVLGYFSHLFVQNKNSAELLKTFGFSNVTIAGDTRFDRVAQIANKKKAFPMIQDFSENSTLVVAGSTWKEDEDLLIPYINESGPELKWILAPHEIHEEHLQQIVSQLEVNSIRYSEAMSGMEHSCRVLLIDNIGLLSSLYAYAQIAYVGGGFGKGIHNILEPATFGIPIIFGPHFQKFQEASDLVATGGAFPVSSYKELMNSFSSLIEEPLAFNKAGSITRSYVESNLGATKTIVDILLIL